MNKIISNERIMAAIYEAVAPNQSCDNLIETEELAEKYRDFVDSYAYAGRDMDEQEDFIDNLNDVIFSDECIIYLCFDNKIVFNSGEKELMTV